MEVQSPPDTAALYHAAVGDKKAEYYVPRFLAFDEPGASRASWNWPALFVPFLWMIYRRIYGPAAIYFFALPVALLIFAVVVMMVLGQSIGSFAYFIAAIGIYFVVTPMYANALYHWHVKKRIAAVYATAPSPDAALQRLIGQASVAGPATIVLIALFAMVPVIGILAAIAIPAYQDYTIRSQVTEGLRLAAPVKAAVAASYEDKGAWPATLEEAGLNPDELGGTYTEAVVVDGGAILIRYGNQANRLIAGGTLALQPVVLQGEAIEWDCGYSTRLAGDSANVSAAKTDVLPKYLPSACRDN